MGPSVVILGTVHILRQQNIGIFRPPPPPLSANVSFLLTPLPPLVSVCQYFTTPTPLSKMSAFDDIFSVKAEDEIFYDFLTSY